LHLDHGAAATTATVSPLPSPFPKTLKQLPDRGEKNGEKNGFFNFGMWFVGPCVNNKNVILIT
jgi:hypothetical protein